MLKKSLRRTRWNILLPVLFFLLIGLGLILLDRERISQVLSEADWKVLPGALLFVICSNGFVSYSYVILARLVGIQMGRFELGATYFVTNVLNRLVRSGGAAGFSLRYLMMKQSGVGMNDVLNSSFIHFFLGSLIMLAMLSLVSLYALVTLPVPAGTIPVLIFLAIFGALVGSGVTCILLSERLRSAVARLTIWLAKKIARRDVTPRVEQYARRTAVMVNALQRDRRRLSMVMLLFFAEWTANVIVLGYCLKAFGPALSFGGSAVIYVVATMAGVITALPGGIGIQEGMITTLAVLQGSSFEQAVLAAVLYRFLQTFLPYLLSLGFYPRLMKADAADTGDNNSTDVKI